MSEIADLMREHKIELDEDGRLIGAVTGSDYTPVPDDDWLTQARLEGYLRERGRGRQAEWLHNRRRDGLLADWAAGPFARALAAELDDGYDGYISPISLSDALEKLGLELRRR